MTIRNAAVLAFIAIFTCAIPRHAHAQAPVSDGNSISQRLDRIEKSLNNQGLLDMVQQLQNLEQEIKDLRGQIEVQNHTIEQLQQRQRALYTDLDQRLQALERASGGGAVTTTMTPAPAVGADTGNPPLQTLAPVENQVEPAATNSGTPPPSLSVTPPVTARQTQQPITPPATAGQNPQPITPPATAGQNPQPIPPPVTAGQPQQPITPPATTGQPEQTATLTPMPSTANTLDQNLSQSQAADPALARAAYERAYSLLTQSQYDQAIKAFREYLAVYPGSADADNAQYWIGEAFYVLHQYDQAMVEYQSLIKNYPQSQKYTIALLKVGYCYQQLGQLQQARKALLDLEQRYPQTTAARLAAEHLKAIDAALKQAGSETQITTTN